MSEVKWVSVPSSFIFREDELRLDAEFYSKERLKAQVLIEELKKQGIGILNVGDNSVVKDIFWPGRFKRKYVSSKEGKPFLTPKEIFTFKISPRKFVTGYPQDVEIEKDWILVTRSGSVGRLMISNSILTEFILSDDIIRVIPNSEFPFGYIYAYLNTWIGQAFLTKTNYGGPIKHIEPHHVASIPIPILDEDIMKRINKKILKAHKIREEAQLKLIEAEEMFYQELGLPKIDEDDVEYFGGEAGKKVKAFTVKASELNMRFDASYHNPLAETSRRRILKESQSSRTYILKYLKEIADSYTPPRFRRMYVNPEEGVPLLQGSHVPMIKIFDLKYQWKGMKGLEKYILKKGWILVTCSGTLGKTALVSSSWEGWIATNHITRLIPKDSTEINPGFLALYIQTTYGQSQILALSYGAVVEEIGEAGELFDQILVPLPDKSIQDKIGNLVIEAYELKDKANMLEQEAVSMLEKHLEELSGVSL